LNAIGAATKVIYPSAGYHTEDAAEGAKIGRPDITIVALADLFEDRLLGCKRELAAVGIDVAANRCFVGFDAYEKLLADPEVNYVIQATPPHFRPMHLLAAIKAGKHVFIEKPAAVDAPGVRMVMEAGKLAEANGLGIAAGTQRRHLRSYQETIQRLRDGAIGLTNSDRIPCRRLPCRDCIGSREHRTAAQASRSSICTSDNSKSRLSACR
jgi:predicted dehydrogenase